MLLVLLFSFNLTGSGETVPGFLEFTYKEIIPVCFLVPIQAFDTEDAQAYLVNTFHEFQNQNCLSIFRQLEKLQDF